MKNPRNPVSETNKPLDWVDNLRIIALFAVIMLHCSSPLLADYIKSPRAQWLAADFYNALTRFAVPVFVMITGVLLLGKEEDVTVFLKKRLGRILLPFLFWSLVYVAYAYYNEEIAYTGDTWATVKQVLHQLKYGSSYHLWYVYMLIGLYLIIPVLGKFIRNATEKETLYFLLVWLVVMLFSQPYLIRYNPQVDVRYFGGYIGYLVLGYYLANKQFNNRRMFVMMAALAVLAVAVITWGTAILYHHYNGISTLMYEPLSWPIVLSASAIFMMMRYTKPLKYPALISIRNFIGKYNYGIYLGHALILTLLDYDETYNLSYKSFNPFFSIPLTAMVCFVLTLLLVYLINKIPFIGRHISG